MEDTTKKRIRPRFDMEDVKIMADALKEAIENWEHTRNYRKVHHAERLLEKFGYSKMWRVE